MFQLASLQNSEPEDKKKSIKKKKKTLKASQTEQSQTNGGEASGNSLEISSQEAKNKNKKCINFQFCQQMTDFRDLIAGSYSESLNITDLSEKTCGAYRVFGTGFHTH